MDVGVDLSRREIRVAEHGLDAAEIGPVLEQVRRETMAQLMGTDGPADASRFRIAADQDPDPLPAQMVALSARKHEGVLLGTQER